MTGVEFLVRGQVQGVGFRPFVYRLACEERLAGEVRNTGDGVTIRVWGTREALVRFRARLGDERPALAEVEIMRERPLAADAPPGFAIAPSETGGGRAAITPDAAICADCLGELADPDDRRYRYPFINCVQCGPRFSIIGGLPYDRARTTMAAFTMCADCAREYADPADRRHHAEPVACPACGPRAWLEDEAGATITTADPIAEAARLLRDGRIVAVKGLGGFHLAVRAHDEAAVMRLRQRKKRPAKPLALMVRDLAVAERVGVLCDAARAALLAASAPIVLVPARTALPGIAPGLAHVGLMLPYTPLHVLLMETFDEPLVMTSANRSGEPQVTELGALRERLGGVADAVLTHDRPIANRVDDSLMQIADGAPQVLRRGRGLAPRPVRLPQGFGEHPPVLAFGGDLKHVFALAHGGEAVLSQHIGDLDNPAAAAAAKRTLALMSRLCGFAAARVAADAHPAYRTRRMAEGRAAAAGVPLDLVLHHHAHAAAAMVEHSLPLDHPPILALALDGIGYGEDGALWGCELLAADYRSVRRLGGLAPAPLPGGDRAAKEPWRNLLARLVQAFGEDPARWPAVFSAALAPRPVETLLAAGRAGINAPLASSAGRLFDALASAAGLCERQDYEGEAAMRLQAAAEAAGPGAKGYAFVCHGEPGAAVLDPAPIWSQIADDLAGAAPASTIAARFHAGLADGLHALVRSARAGGDGARVVALTGGTFQNAVLARLVRERLAADGLTVLEHRAVPAGDGGLAVGQAAVAIARAIG